VANVIKVAKVFLFVAPFVERNRGPRAYKHSVEGVDTALLVMLLALQLFEKLNESVEDESIPWEDPPLLITNISENDAQLYFRYRKDHLQRIADKLWPRVSTFFSDDSTRMRVKCHNRNVSPYETGILMMLFRFSRPVRIRPEMERYFHTRKTKMSNILKTFYKAFYLLALPYLTRPEIWMSRLQLYADLVYDKSNGAVSNVWGFIDGTLRKTCRPYLYQESAYSGHKRCHGIKFQSIIVPEGLIALLYGPIAGARHDSWMLTESGILQRLEELLPIIADGVAEFMLYGDPAYPLTAHMFGGFRHTIPGSAEARWNTEMSRVRETVEWMFKEVTAQFRYIDFRASMKIFKEPVGMYYFICVFLTNIRCTLYWNQTRSYFLNTRERANAFDIQEDPGLTFEEYIDLVDPAIHEEYIHALDGFDPDFGQ